MSESRKTSRSRLILGVTLIVIGMVYTLDECGWMSADWLHTYWPLALVAIGVSKLLWPATGGGRFGGLIVLVIGSLLLANNLDWIEIRPWQVWPFVLMLLGLRLVLSPGRPWYLDDSSILKSFTFLGGTTTRNCSSDFQGGELVAVMGGADVDLRQANISVGPVVIDTFAMWGGIDIKVPRDWSVTAQGIPLIGAFEDATDGPALDDDFADLRPRQQLIVKGFAIMGGVSVGH